MQSFNEYFHANKVDGDPGATALAICKALKLTNSQRELLIVLIEDYCEQMERRRVRSVEFNGPAGKRVADPTGDRAAYLSERFSLGDGTMVRWDEATVADHQARINFLEAMRGGITATIGRHRAAVQLIEANKVACLGEIAPADLPATLAPTAIELEIAS